MMIIIALLVLLFSGVMVSKIFDVIWTLATNFIVMSVVAGIIFLVVFLIKRRRRGY